MSKVKEKQGGFFSNAIWYSIGAFVLQGINLITAPVFSNLLEPGDYGVISVYLLWVAIFGIIISCQFHSSFNNAVTTFGAEKLNSYIYTVTRVCGIPTIALISFALFFPSAAEKALNLDIGMIYLAIINSFFFAIINISTTKYICLANKKSYLFLSLSTGVLSVAVSIAMVMLMRDNRALGRALGYMLGYAIVGVVCLLIIIKNRGVERQGFIRFALPISLPLIIHEIAHLLSGQASRYFLSILVSDEAAGVYSFAYSIGSVSIVAAGAFNNAWTPWYFKMTKQDETLSINIMARKYIMIFGMLICGMICVTPEIIKFVTPESYWDGIKSVPIILMSGFCVALFNVVSNYEVYKEKTRYISYASVAACVINMALNMLLIPRVGMIGAAAATLISYLLQLITAIIVGKFVIKGINLEIKNVMRGMALVTAFVVMCYLCMDMWVIRWLLGVGCAVYCLMNIRTMFMLAKGE